MELQIVLVVLGAASVASTFIYALKSLLDQIPELIRSWRRVVHEAKQHRSPESEASAPPASTDTPDRP